MLNSIYIRLGKGYFDGFGKISFKKLIEDVYKYGVPSVSKSQQRTAGLAG